MNVHRLAGLVVAVLLVLGLVLEIRMTSRRVAESEPKLNLASLTGGR